MKFDRQPSTKRNRNRKIIWFNPPFSQNVETNTGKLFFKLVRKNSPENHKFRKIFNLNTLKLSYSSMKQHNAKVLTDGKKPTRLCNWRYKDSCPLVGKCLAKCTVYKCTAYSSMEHQTECSKLSLTTILACLGTKGIQLILNFPNTSGNQVRRKFSTRLNGILLHMLRRTSVFLGGVIYASHRS